METTRILSEDAAAVRETLDAMYPGCIVGRMPAGRARFEWHSLRVDDVTLVDYSTTTPLRLDVRLEPLWSIARVQGTAIRGTVGDDTVDTHGALLFPPDPVRLEWRDMHTRGATFDGARAERLARGQVGDDRLVLRPLGTRAISPLHEEFWWSTWGHCREALSALEGRDEPLVESSVRTTLVAAALHAFPTTLRDHRADGRQHATPQARVRRAIAWIDENAHRDITVADVAAAVDLSGRGLRQAFLRAEHGEPAAYLRRVRLAAVRAELRAADTAVDTMTVARAWGFARRGRFARLYEREFGVSPDADRSGG